MNNSCIEHFLLVGPDIRSSDSYIECYICVQLLQYVSLKFSFCGVFFCIYGAGYLVGGSFWGSGCSAVETPRFSIEYFVSSVNVT